MQTMQTVIAEFQERIQAACFAATPTPLRVVGGGTKDFYGQALVGETLLVGSYRGVIDYEPKELVLTVRAGTPLAEIEALLSANGQQLPFEPPHWGAQGMASEATIGGAVACGLSGPRRPYVGAVRDFVLGARILNGRGEDLSFGGRVIKNVAGYDVSRLMVGAFGTLGVLLDLSFKVLPKPAAEATLSFAMDATDAIRTLNQWAGQPLPLSGSCYHEGQLLLRLSGAQAAVNAAVSGGCNAHVGGDRYADSAASAYWLALREQRLPFFALAADESLLRVSVPQTTPPLAGMESALIEWGGGLRWVKRTGLTAAELVTLRSQVGAVGGHVTLMRRPASLAALPVFHPMAGGVAKINRRLKQAFDQNNILNVDRVYDYQGFPA